MSLSRQGILGAVLFIGGSVMLYAMVQKVNDNTAQTTDITANSVQMSDVQSNDVKSNQHHQGSSQNSSQSIESDLMVEPLTTDIETEKQILAKKQQQRIANVKEQERRTQVFLEENQKAVDVALAKARAESEIYAAKNKAKTDNGTEPADNLTTAEQDNISRPVVTARQAPKQPPAKNQQQASASQATNNANETTQNTQANNTQANKAPPKSPINHTVKRGDGLIRLARQYNVSLEALATMNKLATDAELTLGQQLIIPSGKQIARLEREAKEAEKAKELAKQKAQREKQLKAEQEKQEKRQQELLAQKSAEAKRASQQKLKEARQTVKETDAKGNFGVQVALASNQQRADEVAAKFKKAGYQVSTSQTSRGVRVMVGPERGKIAAIALKDKINSDPNVGTTEAWVLYWR
ncbi:LysM peptidoglycan-binding domain-containing protein [Moraxella lincolnii]|uniref:LysM peptidoglycan-binding domain-containing protein n=1 Tax=Lwoffella lincolnii TaxID=90241 RepID=UPI0030CA956C